MVWGYHYFWKHPYFCTFRRITNLQIRRLTVNQVAHVSDARNVEFPLVHVHTGQNVARGKEATFAHDQCLGQSHLKVQQLKATSTLTVFDPSVPSSTLDLSWPWSIQSQWR